MLTYSKLNLLLGCFNQNVFSDAKMNIEWIKTFYGQDPFGRDNTLVNKLIYIISNYKFTDITEGLFISAFQSDGKSDSEIAELVSRIKEYKSYNKDQSKVFRDDLREICYNAAMTRARNKHPEDSVAFMEELNKFSYKTNVSNNLVVKNFRELDITDLAQMYSGEGYKSSFKFVNNAFTCGGWIPGQIVSICACPGAGKSLFIENEIVSFVQQGKRCHILQLGDLNELDLAIRMTCMMSKLPRRVIESDIVNYYEMYKNKFSDYLGITCVPSGIVSAREYVDWMLDIADQYDVLVVDYDANFKRDGNAGMYLEFGEVYDAFTELSRLGKLIFVATQPKIGYYRAEEIPLEGLGESSRKQQIVDCAITIGKRSESKMRMGKMTIVKNRRGDLGQQEWIGTSEGLFYECSKLLYAKYRNQQDYVGLYKYSELEDMDLMADVFADEEEVKEAAKV